VTPIRQAVRSARGQLSGQKASTLVTTVVFVVIAGLTFVNAIILTNGLGAAGRGAVATAYGATIVFGWAFQFGLPASAAYYAKDLDHRDILNAAWRMCVMGAIPFALLLTPFYLWQFNGIAFEEGGQSLKLWYLAFVAVHILQSPFQSAVFYLRGVGSTVMFNLLLAAPQLLITLGYSVLYLTGNLTVTSALASTMIMMTSGWIIALTASGSWPSFGVKSEHFEAIRSYALRSWIGSLSFIISLRVDQMLLVGFVDLSDLGIYAVAAALATLSSPVARAISQSLQPFIRHAATDEERLARISRSLRWTVMASLCVLVPLGLAAEFFIPIVFGDEFSESVFPLLILLPGAFASDVNQIFSTALAGFNQPEKASRAQVYSAITTVIGLLALLGPYGIVGAAITSSIAYSVGAISTGLYWRGLAHEVRAGRMTGSTVPVSV
jgi:O-antigen/teichoic acid export membrane protein